MAFYSGPSFCQGSVSIGQPDPDLVQQIPETCDVRDSIVHWFSEARIKNDVLYFSIFLSRALVGQILLHDLDYGAGESLVGYHLFAPQFRGQGIGTQALRLLQRFVLTQAALRTLFIITSRDNLASQRIAQKCGFTYVGRPREDLVNGLVFEWRVAQSHT